jgi:hypothetical protein
VSHTKSDHALIVVKAALNAVPVVGGSIASLIGDYIPLSTQRSIERSGELLAKRLADLEGRIDSDAVDKDEFSELFKSCYLTIVRTSQEVKLRAAAAILANLLLRPGDPEKLSYTELDHLTRCLGSLSIGAITTLGAAKQMVVRAKMSPDGEGNYRFNFEQLRAEVPSIEPALFMGLVGELNGYNLLRIEGLPPIRTPEYANHPLELTPLGWRFVERFLEP